MKIFLSYSEKLIEIEIDDIDYTKLREEIFNKTDTPPVKQLLFNDGIKLDNKNTKELLKEESTIIMEIRDYLKCFNHTFSIPTHYDKVKNIFYCTSCITTDCIKIDDEVLNYYENVSNNECKMKEYSEMRDIFLKKKSKKISKKETLEKRVKYALYKLGKLDIFIEQQYNIESNFDLYKNEKHIRTILKFKKLNKNDYKHIENSFKRKIDDDSLHEHITRYFKTTNIERDDYNKFWNLCKDDVPRYFFECVEDGSINLRDFINYSGDFLLEKGGKTGRHPSRQLKLLFDKISYYEENGYFKDNLNK